MGVIQGMDTIPKEIGNGPLGKLLQGWLPGWVVNGQYNYAAGAITQ